MIDTVCNDNNKYMNSKFRVNQLYLLTVVSIFLIANCFIPLSIWLIPLDFRNYLILFNITSPIIIILFYFSSYSHCEH